MFQSAAKGIRESVYGILCHSNLGDQEIADHGSGFMIAPGIIATVAHVLHRRGDRNSPLHDIIEVIRSPDIGLNMETAYPLVVDSVKDMTLIRVENPQSLKSVKLERKTVSSGTSCGSLGFPLASVRYGDDGWIFTLIERFQGGYVSAYLSESDGDRKLDWYETDSMMYGGSSGCPVFKTDGNVFGMQSATLVAEEGANE